MIINYICRLYLLETSIEICNDIVAKNTTMIINYICRLVDSKTNYIYLNLLNCP